MRVILQQEDLDTANTSSELMISIIKSIAQAENESRRKTQRDGSFVLSTSLVYGKQS